MRIGYTEDEYSRVRDWLLSALTIAPGPFDEVELIEKLRYGDWELITTENAACVIQFCEFDGERIANVLLIGGRIGGSLREIMTAYSVLCDYLSTQKFAKLCGTPRTEWHRFLLKYGFEQQGKEFIKRLNIQL